ncbi:MAG: hypothetical protein FRX48_09742 [Lasallia pustulata]|uniref:PQ-loop repeat n=1 Tax=Lasallia pustulata TaxID=136370 RepID=A0A5M8PB38_9LECA|nr:MAG: hypothetical protein FRX48_09742 [Lasallia pustulata]
MSSLLFLGSVSPSLPDHCTPTNDFLFHISSTFHACVPTPLAFLSISLGTISIVSWLFAQLPQVFTNYKLKSTAGLSIYFLGEWLLGDATNLSGALLTGQATWQVIVAGYYVTVDMILVGQYIWYTHYKPGRGRGSRAQSTEHRRENGDMIEGSPPYGDASDDNTHIKGTVTSPTTKPATQPQEMNGYRTPNFSSPEEKGTPTSSHTTIQRLNPPPSFGPSPKTLLLVSMLCAVLTTAHPTTPHDVIRLSPQSSDPELLGRILSWTSTLLYLGSRLPQIYKNHRRRSTAGLSPTLFIAAFFGNLFYSSSLLTNPLAWDSYPPYGSHGWAGGDGSERWEWVGRAAPFWLGAAGVLALDAAVGAQFLMFGKGKGKEEAVVGMEGWRGRGRWMRVRGWMRGWVPSESPVRGLGSENGSDRGSEGAANVDEDERPLLEREGSGDVGYGTRGGGSEVSRL